MRSNLPSSGAHVFWTLLFMVSGCSAPQTVETTDSRRVALVLSDAERIKPGLSDRSAVMSAFGNADLETNLEGMGQIAWLYLEGTHRATRLSIVFKGDVVDSVTWFVNDSDPETKLPLAKKRYSAASFKVRPRPGTNPHAVPDEDIYSDEKLGLTIVHARTPDRVNSISWRKSQRQLATEK